jgi:hypothetical protein
VKLPADTTSNLTEAQKKHATLMRKWNGKKLGT